MSVQRISSFKTFTELKGQQSAAKLHEEGKTKRAEIVSKIGAALEEMGVTSLQELDEEKRTALISKIFNEDRAEDVEKDINDLGEPKKEDEKEADKVQAANESLITEGTRSQIGKIGKDGKIVSVYVHYDGYPENMVPLLKNYKDSKAVDQLVTLGKAGISYLDKKIGEKPMDFNNPDKGVTLFYGRDRNEKGDMSTKADSKDIKKYLKTVSNKSGAEYVYLFDERDGKWYMADAYEDKELKPVSESLLLEKITKPSSSFISRAKGLVKTASMKSFKAMAKDMIDDLTEDGFEADEVIEWLAFELYDVFGESVEIQEDKAEEIEADINDLGEVEKEDQTDAEKVQADLYEARSINKIQNEWTKVTAEMKSTVDSWKKAEGDAKAPLLAKLKELTAKKNALESELNDAISDKDKDLELVVSEGNAFVFAAAKAKQEGKDEFEINGKKYKVTLKKHALKEDVEEIEATEVVEDVEITEGKYSKDQLLKLIADLDDAEIVVKGKKYIIYNPDSNNDDNAAMWKKDTIDAVDSDGDEHTFKYSDIQQFNESIEVNEADEIKSDEEFKEYAFKVLKQAFADEFEESKAQEVVDGILKVAGDNYGEAVGMLTSSLG